MHLLQNHHEIVDLFYLMSNISICYFSNIIILKHASHGLTRNIGLLRLRPKDKVKVSSNKYGQLVDEINGCRLMSYMGTLVHNQHNVPL